MDTKYCTTSYIPDFELANLQHDYIQAATNYRLQLLKNNDDSADKLCLLFEQLLCLGESKDIYLVDSQLEDTINSNLVQILDRHYPQIVQKCHAIKFTVVNYLLNRVKQSSSHRGLINWTEKLNQEQVEAKYVEAAGNYLHYQYALLSAPQYVETLSKVMEAVGINMTDNTPIELKIKQQAIWRSRDKFNSAYSKARKEHLKYLWQLNPEDNSLDAYSYFDLMQFSDGSGFPLAISLDAYQAIYEARTFTEKFEQDYWLLKVIEKTLGTAWRSSVRKHKSEHHNSLFLYVKKNIGSLEEIWAGRSLPNCIHFHPLDRKIILAQNHQSDFVNRGQFEFALELKDNFLTLASDLLSLIKNQGFKAHQDFSLTEPKVKKN